MINPDQREKNLTEVDTKVQRKTAVLTVVLSLAIIGGVFAAAELAFRAVNAMLEK